jgi:hypothetical protein
VRHAPARYSSFEDRCTFLATNTKMKFAAAEMGSISTLTPSWTLLFVVHIYRCTTEGCFWHENPPRGSTAHKRQAILFGPDPVMTPPITRATGPWQPYLPLCCIS